MPQEPLGRDPKSLVPLDAEITKAATEAGINPDLFRRLITQESRGKVTARGPKTRTGEQAEGLGQLMPGTAKPYKINTDNPVENLRVSATEFKGHLDYYKGDEAKALAAYNAGRGAVDKYGGIPPYKETRGYVKAIQEQGRPAPTGPPPAATPPGEEGRDPATLVNISAGSRPVPPPVVAPVPARTLQIPLPGGQPFVTVPRPSMEGIFALPSMLAGVPQQVGEALGRGAQQTLGTPEGRTAAINVGIPAAASVAGGVLGAGRGGPMGAAAGAATMAPVGEAVAMGVNALRGAPPTQEEFLSRTQWAPATALAGEGVGQAAIKAGRPFVKSFDPVLASHAFERFTERLPRPFQPGMIDETRHVLPSEVSGSRALNLLENITESSFAGGGAAARVREARQRIAEKDVLQTLGSLGPRQGTRGAGETLQEVRDRAVTTYRGEQKAKYGAFQEKGGTIPVGSSNLDAFAQEISGRGEKDLKPGAGLRLARRITQMFAPDEDEAAEAAAIGFKGGRPEVQPAKALAAMSREQQDKVLAQTQKGGMNLQQAIQQVATETKGAPPEQMNATQANEMVKSLGRWMRQLERETKFNADKNADYGLVKKLYGLAKQDLDESLMTADPKAFDLLEAARTHTREGSQRLFNKDVLEVARAKPEKIAETLMQRNNSSAIGLVENAVGKEGMAPIRVAAMEHVLRPDPVSKRVKWPDVLKRFTSMGEDTRRALFPGDHAHDAMKIAELMLDLEKKPLGQTGKVAVQLMQAGAGVALVTNLVPALTGKDSAQERAMKGAAVILGPAALAKVFASPTGLKWLTTGLTHGAKTQTGIRAGAQLMAFLVQEGLISPEQAKQGVPTPPPDPSFGINRPGAPPSPEKPFSINR
jgi:hypothetical protein